MTDIPETVLAGQEPVAFITTSGIGRLLDVDSKEIVSVSRSWQESPNCQGVYLKPQGPAVATKPLDWSNFEGPKRNTGWQPDIQELIYTALNHLDGEGDADEDAGEQIIELLLAALRSALIDAPEPGKFITNPDIGRETGNAEIDSLIHRLLDAQQDINLEANERMSQPLCGASALIDDVEALLRRLAASPTVPAETFTREQMLAEVDRRLERAMAARGALELAPPAPAVVRGDNETPEAEAGPFARRTQLGYPPLGWTCFHCGETFTTTGSARDHFGCSPNDDPACRIKVGEERGLVMALRKAEAEIARLTSEERDYQQFVAANTPPAPAVAIKPLEWVEGWCGSDDDYPCWRAKNPFGMLISVSFVAAKRHADVDPNELKGKLAAAQADYEARIRSSLVFETGIPVTEQKQQVAVHPIDKVKEQMAEALRTIWENSDGSFPVYQGNRNTLVKAVTALAAYEAEKASHD